jgi:SAM-dependent methyltransferase
MESPPFGALADHYDAVMGSVDYDQWATYILEVLQTHGSGERSGPIADLGCGTGAIARRLAAVGHPVVALDLAPAMVRTARQRGGPIRYGVADICRLPLRDNHFAAAVCLFDTINYLLTPEALRATCAEAARILQPGAPFAFDLNTPFAFENYWCGEEQVIVNDSDLVAIWDGHMESDIIARLDLTLFHAAPHSAPKAAATENTAAGSPTGDLFQRVVEIHRERAHSQEEIRTALDAVGFTAIEIYEHLTDAPPHAETERILVVARAPRLRSST